jgi:hypothetical protein
MKWSGLISAIVLASGSFVVFSPYPVKEEEREKTNGIFGCVLTSSSSSKGSLKDFGSIPAYPLCYVPLCAVECVSYRLILSFYSFFEGGFL